MSDINGQKSTLDKKPPNSNQNIRKRPEDALKASSAILASISVSQFTCDKQEKSPEGASPDRGALGIDVAKSSPPPFDESSRGDKKGTFDRSSVPSASGKNDFPEALLSYRDRAFKRHDAMRYVLSNFKPKEGDMLINLIEVMYADEQRKYLRGHKSYFCRSAIVPLSQGEIRTRTKGDTLKAYYGNLRVCNNYVCPLCAPIRGQREAFALGWAIGKAIERGYNVAMMTFTISHSKYQKSAEVLELLYKAYSEVMTKGQAWQRIKDAFDLLPIVKRLDSTRGDNGWHHHFHALVCWRSVKDAEYYAQAEGKIIRKGLDDVYLPKALLLPSQADADAEGDADNNAFALLGDKVMSRWLSSVEKVGGFASLEHGFDMRRGDASIAEYIAKWGKEPKQDSWGLHDEMSRSDVKQSKGRSSFELLDGLNVMLAKLDEIKQASPEADEDAEADADALADKIQERVNLLGDYYHSLRVPKIRRTIEGLNRLVDALGGDYKALKNQAEEQQKAQIEDAGEESFFMSFDASWLRNVTKKGLRSKALKAVEVGHSPEEVFLLGIPEDAEGDADADAPKMPKRPEELETEEMPQAPRDDAEDKRPEDAPKVSRLGYLHSLNKTLAEGAISAKHPKSAPKPMPKTMPKASAQNRPEGLPEGLRLTFKQISAEGIQSALLDAEGLRFSDYYAKLKD